MSDWGIKVSKEGYDVKTCDIENLSLHSNHQGYIVRTSGYTSGTVTSGSTLSLYGGGTSYLDVMFLGFIEIAGSGKWFQPYVTETTSGSGVFLDLNIDEAKSQAVYADVTATSGSKSVKVYMILLFNQDIDA